MVCLGFEPRAAGWKAQTNPLSYGGTPFTYSFLKWANPRIFFIYFHLLKYTLQIVQQIGMWKNVHPVYGAGIQTHDLWNMILLP